MEKNQILELQIEDLGTEGEGIGKADGYTVFIPGALPGEKVRALLVKAKKNYGYGKLLEILEPSPDRTEPLCPVAAKCGGCQLQHMSYAGQLRYKQKKVQDCMERIGGFRNVTVQPVLGMEEPFHYRNKAQFPVGKGKDGIEMGFYAKHSHRIVKQDHCLLQHPVNQQILQILHDFMVEFQISAYEEGTHRGLVRHVLTRVGTFTGEIMVCIIINGKKLPHQEVLVERLQQIEGMASIQLNINREQTNVILGKKNMLLWGKPAICDTVDGILFEISPHSFYQVNPQQMQVLYRKALEAADLKGEETVLDLYCGIGTISLYLAQKAKRVFGVEIVPEAVENAKTNAAANGFTNAEFAAGAAEDVIPKLYTQGKISHADVVVVDPPRKGCDQILLETIVKLAPEKLVYVSCDPATLARDASYLRENGYQLESVQPVDMFPMTAHIETVCALSRIK